MKLKNGSSPLLQAGNLLDVNKASIICLFFLAVCCSSCTAHTGLTHAVSPNVSSAAEPLSLSVTNEINNGERLRIAANVVVLVEWPSNDAEVELVTMHGENIVERRRTALKDLIQGSQPMLVADQSYPILLDVPSKGADNYQLSLLWGAETQTDNWAEFKTLNIERMAQECNPNCSEKISIIGELANKGTKPLNSLQLQIEVFKVPVGEQALALQASSPDNVQQLSISGLNIVPTKQRKLKLVLDTPLETPAAGFEYRFEVKVVKVNE